MPSRDPEIRFRATFENAAVGIAHVGLDGSWLAVNDRLCDIVGYTREELLELTFQDITHAEDLDADVAQLQSMLADEIDTYNMEKRYIRKGGEEVWINLTVSGVHDADSKLIYFVSVVEDISERKGYALALKASEERLRAVVETAIDAIIMIDSDGIVQSFNPAAEGMFGYTSDEVVGHNVKMLMPGEIADGHDDFIGNYLRTGVAKLIGIGRDITARRKDGTHFPVSAGVGEWRDPNGAQLFTGILRDISEQKRAEAHRELLIGELNHRVKNSLAVIQSMASFTLSRANSLETFGETFTGRLMAIAGAHDILINNDNAGADLSELISRLVGSYTPVDGIRVRLDGPRIFLGSASAHAFGLILHELAVNAGKYGALSSTSGHVEITWAAETMDGQQGVSLSWTEHGGPPVTPPRRKGFGTLLIQSSLTYALGGKADLDYAPDGLRATFFVPLGETNE